MDRRTGKRQSFNALAGNQHIGKSTRSLFPGRSEIESLYKFSENIEPNYYDDQEKGLFREKGEIKRLIESLEKTNDEVQS